MWIGDNVMLGPSVIITAVSHPMLAVERVFRVHPNSFELKKRLDTDNQHWE